MNKMFAVVKREYLQAVRRKMFIFMTLFFPVLMAALFIVPGLMMAKGLGGKKVAVVDGTGALQSSFAHHIEPAAPEPDIDLLALNEALTKLEIQDKRKAELVKLRFFAGMTNAEAALALGISTSTADNDWAYARCWLRVAIDGQSSEP